MKNYIYKSLFILTLLFSYGCEEYLDIAPESSLTIEEVFKDFEHAQGFVEEMYPMVVDYGTGGGWQTDFLYGDDGIMNRSWSSTTSVDKGDLMFWVWSQNAFFGTRRGEGGTNNANAMNRPGIWDGSVQGIRKANIAIENIDLMINASDEEKNVILGQAYFFRAFFHFEIMKYWGRFPHIDRVLRNDYKMTRPETYKESALAVNEDFKKAAELLPVDWDNESYGALRTLGQNKGRVTKGAAYAFMGKNLLIAASPLMHGSDDTYNYDTELCNMAVDAFAEVLKLADEGVYERATFDEYETVFWKVPANKVWPGAKEFIFNGTSGAFGRTKALATISMDNQVAGGSAILMSPTHNFIHNNFGMANGLSIEDDLSGAYGTPTYDPTKPFDGRDPRFYKWITVDGDKLSAKTLTGANAKHNTAKLYTGGVHRAGSGSQTGYFFKKFYPELATKWDGGRFNKATPWRIRMRLTDVYLMYAEALHAAKNSATTAPASYNLSAEQVINEKIRGREGFNFPPVHPSIVADANKFMDELRRERTVELSFEAHRWVDIRRWSLAHLEKYRRKTGLDFPADHSYFNEFLLIERVCEYPKHMWMPFETNQTQFYEGFPQNPGW